MKGKNWFKWLFSIGVREGLPEFKNRKIYHSNVVALIFILVFQPFLIVSFHLHPSLGWIVVAGVTVISFNFPLNWLGFNNFSRVLHCTAPISLATAYTALVTPAGEPPWGQLFTLYFMFIFIPTTVIDYKEPLMLISMLGFGIVLINFWHPLNNYFELDPAPDVAVWKTGWFGYWTIVMSLGIGLGSVLSMSYRSSVAEEKSVELLKKYYDIELLNAELKAVRSQFNPHFIFNALASIQQFILSNDKLKANQYLTRFSRLIRITLQNSDELVISLAQEYEGLKYYLEIEQMRLTNKFLFRFEHDPEVDLEQIQVPSMLLQIFAENAIWHGLAPKEGGGQLTIRTLKRGTCVVIELEDDGIGRKASAARKVGKQHESKGMKMTEDKLNLFNLNRAHPLTLQMIDLEDEAGNAQGTRVEVVVPLDDESKARE